MIRLPDYDGLNIVKWSEQSIPQDILRDEGIEREAHVTIAYGFAPDVYAEEVFESVKKITGGMRLVLPQWRWICMKASMPSITGMCRSHRIRSNDSSRVAAL